MMTHQTNSWMKRNVQQATPCNHPHSAEPDILVVCTTTAQGEWRRTKRRCGLYLIHRKRVQGTNPRRTTRRQTRSTFSNTKQTFQRTDLFRKVVIGFEATLKKHNLILVTSSDVPAPQCAFRKVQDHLALKHDQTGTLNKHQMEWNFVPSESQENKIESGEPLCKSLFFFFRETRIHPSASRLSLTVPFDPVETCLHEATRGYPA